MSHSSTLGAAAVLGAILAFGSFGAPIKSKRLVNAEVHPVVIQCYKTGVCFATCWLALLAAPLRFTWWGTLGAAIWVLNGIAAIVAIQAAGLAVAQALWSGLTVLVSFVWGVVVFREHIRRMPLAIAGLCLMAVGMAAIGVVSAAAAAPLPHGHASDPGEETQQLVDGAAPSSSMDASEVEMSAGGGQSTRALPEAPGPPPPAAVGASAASVTGSAGAPDGRNPGPLRTGQLAVEAGRRHSYRAGIACAVYVGIANGSFLVPLKYANRTVTGMEYLVSFGIGAALVTLAVVALYALTAPPLGWRPLELKWRDAAPAAGLAGLLWSTGNVCSIIATENLGLSLAWPAVQAQLLVSTTWGALYFREARGAKTFAALLTATAAVVAGVAMLAAAKG